MVDGATSSLRSLLDAAPARPGTAHTRIRAAACAVSAPSASARIFRIDAPSCPRPARRAVRAVVARSARARRLRPGLLQARKYASRSRNYLSHAFVQIAEKLLRARMRNRVYDGVKLNHAATLKEVSKATKWSTCPATAATWTTC
jgi:hypothetical protein